MAITSTSSVLGRLFASRKFVVYLLTFVLSLASGIGARFGLGFDVEMALGMMVPIVVLGYGLIAGIATEDAAEKGAAALAAAQPSRITEFTRPLDASSSAAHDASEEPTAVLKTTDIERGSSPLVVVLALTIATVFGMAACSLFTSNDAKEDAHAAYDCAKPDAAELVAQFGPAFGQLLQLATGNDGKIDHGIVRPAIEHFTSKAARCVAATAIARAKKITSGGSVQSEGKTYDAADLAELEAQLGGVYVTVDGAVGK